MRERVTPTLRANGLWNPFTRRKRYTITCGLCSHAYSERVPVATDAASSLCPCCGSQNVWSHSEFADAYDRHFAAHQNK